MEVWDIDYTKVQSFQRKACKPRNALDEQYQVYRRVLSQEWSAKSVNEVMRMKLDVFSLAELHTTSHEAIPDSMYNR